MIKNENQFHTMAWQRTLFHDICYTGHDMNDYPPIDVTDMKPLKQVIEEKFRNHVELVLDGERPIDKATRLLIRLCVHESVRVEELFNSIISLCADNWYFYEEGWSRICFRTLEAMMEFHGYSAPKLARLGNHQLVSSCLDDLDNRTQKLAP